ncbi:hypothetical protein Tco_1231469, partial [Tanacetum coccineum]
IGRLCIATKHKQLTDEEVPVLINGENFIVHVRELSNWSVKIEDELESEDRISDNEQAESHSVNGQGLELFRLRSMWSNYSFDYACSMERGLSGGIIPMWDPTVFTKENIWCNDNYVIVQEVLDDNHNLKAIVLDRLWSDHSLILLHTLKTDYGPISFKFFHHWFQRKDIDVVVNQAFVDTPQASTVKNEVNRKNEAIDLLQDIDHKIDSSMALDSEKETRFGWEKNGEVRSKSVYVLCTFILVNGSYTSEFSIKRGLCQGDPLSLFLYILIMEGLQIAIKDATRSNLIKGVTVGNPCMSLSHFFYVDDAVLITEWNQVDMDNII